MPREPIPADVDTSDPFIARDIPTGDESYCLVRVRDPIKSGIDFSCLLVMIRGSLRSRRNSIVAPGGNTALAIEFIVAPVLKNMMQKRRRVLRARQARACRGHASGEEKSGKFAVCGIRVLARLAIIVRAHGAPGATFLLSQGEAAWPWGAGSGHLHHSKGPAACAAALRTLRRLNGKLRADA